MLAGRLYLKSGSMSRVGKQIITVPEKVEVSLRPDGVTVKGPLGEIERPLRREVAVVLENGEITVNPANNSRLARALWGTTAAHIKNMVTGVVTPFKKVLILEGIGYRVELQGTTLKLSVGFSHPVLMPIPPGITVTVEKNVITMTSINKDEVGQFAANIRAIKKPEPYKGKGFRYEGEVIRRKQGKKGAA
jgi:large subunit ribosomal protein L6